MDENPYQSPLAPPAPSVGPPDTYTNAELGCWIGLTALGVLIGTLLIPWEGLDYNPFGSFVGWAIGLIIALRRQFRLS